MEHKFRAWDEDLKKMFTGDWFCVQGSTGEACYFATTWTDELIRKGFVKHGVHKKKIVMRYTGLKDKDGVEIYEGDIVEMWHEEMFFEGTVAGVVEWSDSGAAFSIEHESNGQFVCGIDTDYAMFKVIGNIHQKPELIGG